MADRRLIEPGQLWRQTVKGTGWRAQDFRGRLMRVLSLVTDHGDSVKVSAVVLERTQQRGGYDAPWREVGSTEHTEVFISIKRLRSHYIYEGTERA